MLATLGDTPAGLRGTLISTDKSTRASATLVKSLTSTNSSPVAEDLRVLTPIARPRVAEDGDGGLVGLRAEIRRQWQEVREAASQAQAKRCRGC